MGVDHPGLQFTMSELVRTIRRIARQTIQNASIGRAGIRVYDGGWILIEGGGLSVTGTEVVSGRLEGSGTLDWTGPVNLKGEQTVTGPSTFTGKMTVNGPWVMNGDGAIDGKVDISGPLNVLGVWTLTGNGKITGQMTVDGPWTMNGAGKIVGNTELTGNLAVKSGGSITVQGSGGNVVLSSTYASPRINLGSAQIDGGSSSFTFTAGTQIVYFVGGTIRIPGMPTRSQAQYPGSFPNAVVADSAGNFYRIV